MRTLFLWLINAVSLLLVTHLVPGIALNGLGNALVVALALGLVNTFIRPVLLILTLPVNVLTLGLFTLVINGFSFWLVSGLVHAFYVRSFFSAIIGAVVYSIISWLAASILLEDGRRR
ncbi:MAG: phage holin family protein [Burkholderiales bacterium]|nr:phage holin family protein [Burkholderiales bacterium]